jgi:hypothetical protein
MIGNIQNTTQNYILTSFLSQTLYYKKEKKEPIKPTYFQEIMCFNILTSIEWQNEELIKSVNNNFKITDEQHFHQFIRKNLYLANALIKIANHIWRIFTNPSLYLCFSIDPEFDTESLLIKVKSINSYQEANKILNSFFKENLEIRDKKINKFVSIDVA